MAWQGKIIGAAVGSVIGLLGAMVQAQDPRYMQPQENPSDADRIIESMRDAAQASRESTDSENQTSAMMMGFFWFLLVVAGCMWVAKDARKNHIPCLGNAYDDEKDPKIWAVICFLFCPAFLYYAHRRKTTLEHNRSATPSERRNYVTSEKPDGAITAPLAFQSGTLESQLEVLMRLKIKGLITEDEFEQKRRQLLGL